MRLINVKACSLELFTDPVSVPYAILSHTWAEDEISFQDLEGDREALELREGFVKIRETCRLAIENGLDYAWVDTCCIDKTSSAELSEAINSMFKWYGSAAVCYAFLSDLSKSPSSGDELLKSLEHCRWFTRGWTLQELIAPPEVLFLDEDWNPRGTKSELRLHLELITGVDRTVLYDSTQLSMIPLAKRMSWAAKRKTSRIEDLAYCLLGIFDINMAMIYGEGPKAFIRLQEEILKKTTDLSLFAWQSNDTDTYRGLLARSPLEFQQCGSIIPNTDQFRFREEISLTNKGARINAMLHHSGNGLYIMDLDCYRGNRTSKDRIGIFLSRTVDSYVRRSPQETTSSISSNKPSQIYIQSDIQDPISSGLEDDRNYGIHISFEESGYKYTASNFHAVPQAYWDVNEQFFFTRGLEGFTAFVHFYVSPSAPSAQAKNLEYIGHKSGQRFLLVCDLQNMPEPLFVLYSEEEFRRQGMAPGFIDPFESIDVYGPQGDRDSLALLNSRARSRPQKKLTARHIGSSDAFEVSVSAFSSDEHPHKIEVRINIGPEATPAKRPTVNVRSISATLSNTKKKTMEKWYQGLSKPSSGSKAEDDSSTG
ncbi:hypothetical protein G7Y89_g10983 [Cudoniella acicularis]|uniref:Heterokaryon incompatibility domain-containing protein n=1 Tax=Cudoniella acicularis TaxID=354080 RepID=A0A8H4RBQ3_9HELO|nr:hypothetical protein G7Y89_g10983 [Cudoniella acicularis]